MTAPLADLLTYTVHFKLLLQMLQGIYTVLGWISCGVLPHNNNIELLGRYIYNIGGNPIMHSQSHCPFTIKTRNHENVNLCGLCAANYTYYWVTYYGCYLVC